MGNVTNVTNFYGICHPNKRRVITNHILNESSLFPGRLIREERRILTSEMDLWQNINERSFVKLADLMGKTTTKGDQTRAAILETALELFSRQGYHATTMRQIAEQISLAPGSIYNHFSGKDDLFLSVLRTYHPLAQITPLLVEARGDSTESYIRRLASEIARVLEERPGLLNLTFIEIVELDGQHLPVMAEAFLPQVMAFAQRLSSDPDRLQVQPLKAFRVFIGLMFAYELTDRLLQAALGAETLEPGDLSDFVDVYLHGILLAEQGEKQRDEDN